MSEQDLTFKDADGNIVGVMSGVPVMTDIEKIAEALRETVTAVGYIPSLARKLQEELKSQGLVIVPREPTEGMLLAGYYGAGLDEGDKRDLYRRERVAYAAMITAYEEEQ